jgi:LPXTG-motif cell wall-anchored protein
MEERHMKARKIFMALTLAALLAVMLALPGIAASGDVLYRMTQAEVDAFTANAAGATTVGLRPAGGNPPTFTAEGSGIKITGRTADWNSVDVSEDVFKGADTYTIVVGFKAVSGEVDMAIRNTDSPYGVHAQSGMMASGTVKFTGPSSAFLGTAIAGAQRGVRLSTMGTEDYIITSIVVYEGEPPSSPIITGDSAVLFVAIGALLLCGAGFVVFKKVKA